MPGFAPDSSGNHANYIGFKFFGLAKRPAEALDGP